jgi:hypothetical protein
MAGEVAAAPSPASVATIDSLYRGINPLFYQQGQLTSGVFFLKKKHKIEEGPSVGIANLISLTNFHARMDKGWGAGELSASIPQSLSLRVHPLPDLKWEVHANAHAVITDYQKLTDSGRTNAARALRDALQKNIRIKPTELL